MTTIRAGRWTSRLTGALALALCAAAPAHAAPKSTYGARAIGVVHHRVAPKAIQRRVANKPVPRPRFARGRGYQPMYSDGIGSAVGFNPGPYADDEPLPNGPPVAAWRPYRPGGIRETMAIDLVTRSNGYAYGYPFP